MNETPNYYAIIPANVRYDSDLKDKAKLLYGEIAALSNKNGYCYASNSYFAKLYNVSTQTIINMINNLDEKGYITKEVVYKDGSKEILGRYLKIFEGGSQKILTDNNTSINNKENINININTKERFKKPTLEEIEAYCRERHSSVDPKVFFDYFETGGWVDSKGNKVKNWKQKIITWERNTKPKQEADLPSWFDKDFDTELTEEDRKEFDDLLKM